MSSDTSLQAMVLYLNSLAVEDPAMMFRIAHTRVHCNAKIRNDKRLITVKDMVDFLAIINGFYDKAPNGYGAIYAELVNSREIKFHVNRSYPSVLETK